MKINTKRIKRVKRIKFPKKTLKTSARGILDKYMNLLSQ